MTDDRTPESAKPSGAENEQPSSAPAKAAEPDRTVPLNLPGTPGAGGSGTPPNDPSSSAATLPVLPSGSTPPEALASAGPLNTGPIKPEKNDRTDETVKRPRPVVVSRKRKWLRRLRNVCIAGIVLVIGLWIAVQTNPKVGPALADAARAVFGPRFVAWVEDVAYGAQDKYNVWRHGDDAPKSYWNEPDAAVVVLTKPDAGDGGMDAGVRAFPPAEFTPPFPKAATKADGIWVAIIDDVEPKAPPVFAKSLVHPDQARPYAAVAVVAMDLEKLRLHLVAGTEEPQSDTVKHKDRPGRIPESEHARLVAAFNGGWQAIHGHFGMMIDGVTFLQPKEKSCTVAIYKDSSLRIAPWTDVSSGQDTMQAFRQTPPCLRIGGSHNELLKDTSKNWGAAVDGTTVIRRSAIGLDKSRKVLFYGVGDGLSALTIAEAMGYAGATDVAELDVNWAFPRFLTYSHDKKEPMVKESLIPAAFKPNEYVGISWYRDFFYLTRVPEEPSVTKP
ncbi:MAG: hypothetical protein U0174_11370 [Polyangiaceae bacterium]